jgi:hypothetical protein
VLRDHQTHHKNDGAIFPIVIDYRLPTTMKFIQSLLSVLLGVVTLVSAQPGQSLAEVVNANGLTMLGAAALATGQLAALAGDDELSK